MEITPEMRIELLELASEMPLEKAGDASFAAARRGTAKETVASAKVLEEYLMSPVVADTGK